MIIFNSLNQNLFSTKVNNNKQSSPFNFRGLKPLPQDTVELSSKSKKVTIKDIKGNDKEAEIVFSKDCGDERREKEFVLFVDGERLGYATVRDNYNKNALDLMYLYTEEHNSRSYKGAGTELLKCVIDESFKRGYNGKVKAQASHGSSSPLVFYYKNNFMVNKPYNDDFKRCGYIQNKNASIHYAIMNNIPINNVLVGHDAQAFVYLDEKGAKAFMEGDKLYKERNFEKIFDKNINGVNYSANFVESPFENEYYVMLANEDKDSFKTSLIATLRKQKDENQNEHFVLCDIQDVYSNDENELDFVFEALEKISDEKGYGKLTISKEINEDTQELIQKFMDKFDVEDLK